MILCLSGSWYERSSLGGSSGIEAAREAYICDALKSREQCEASFGNQAELLCASMRSVPGVTFVMARTVLSERWRLDQALATSESIGNSGIKQASIGQNRGALKGKGTSRYRVRRLLILRPA